jgi:phosphoglycolate phosphatase
MVVGDTLDDMHMARAAGVTAIGVLTGITPVEMLRAEADYVLDHAGLVPTLFAG